MEVMYSSPYRYFTVPMTDMFSGMITEISVARVGLRQKTVLPVEALIFINFCPGIKPQSLLVGQFWTNCIVPLPAWHGYLKPGMHYEGCA